MQQVIALFIKLFRAEGKKKYKNPILIAFEEACFFYFFFNIHLNGGGKVSIPKLI